MPSNAYKEGDKSATRVLPGSAGVGKVSRGGKGHAVTPNSNSSMRADYQGRADSRPSSSDRTQSAK